MPKAQANGIELEYTRSGSASDPAIVLIRGLGTQLVEWSPVFLAALQQQQTLPGQTLQVVTFDNRDVGLSTKLQDDYTLTDMADDVVGLLDALALPKAHIFGISLGGMVAQLVGARAPERVRCLFSVMSSSGNPELPRMSKASRDWLMASPADTEPTTIIEQSAASAEYFGSPGYPESLAVRQARAKLTYERCYYPEGVARQMRAAMSDGSRVARLAQIVAPTLVLHGEQDNLVPVAGGEDTAANIPGAELQTVPGMGHNIPDALGEDIARRVGEFIRRHPAV